MAQTIPVKLSKFENQPWGFRLQGGKDFAAPLTIQKVNVGSLAEKAGLRAGDAIIKINDVDVFNLRHKEAQDAIVRAGNNFEIVVSRGGAWKPAAIETKQSNGEPPLAKVSPAAPNKQQGSDVKLINKQFNSPMALYSEESIAETLSAQAEVLAQGVLGVNFKKNEKTYNAASSEVYKMLLEMDRQPKEPEPVGSPVHSGIHFPTEVAKPTSPAPPVAAAAPLKKPTQPAAFSPAVSGGMNPPPAGGVRIFPPGPAPASALQAPKAPAAVQTKVESEYSEVSSTVRETVTYSSSSTTSAFESTSTEVAHSIDAGHSLALNPEVAAPVPAPSAPVTKPVFFNPVSNRPGAAGFGSAPAPAPILPPVLAPSALGSGTNAGVHSSPRRGRGILKPQTGPGVRVPVCASCNMQIRGPFVTAIGRTWCPDHFVCSMPQCRRPLQDVGFVEEKNNLHCEACFENYLAPNCARCQKRVKGDCLNAIGKQFHPECFACAYCGRLFGNNHFYLEDGLPYCEADWNELFTTKCHACGFPIEAGDRWVEAMNSNYHSQCFNCSICKKNLEGQSFLAKGGRPMCKSHAH